VIIEYVPFGDLLGYLRKSRGEHDEYYSDPEIKPNTNLSSQQLLRFGWHVADGMAYLASEKVFTFYVLNYFKRTLQVTEKVFMILN
jgi:hypothetical protein